MNILFISISSLPHLSQHGISLDLIHQLQGLGHTVYIVCSVNSNDNTDTYLSEEAGCSVLRVKIGGNKKANPIIKGITTVTLPQLYIRAIEKHFAGIHFDLVLYPTPPITHCDTVQYIKRRDQAKSYLLLKDIFPQNAVDIGMMRKTGVSGLLYRYFRRKEKKLYALSDRIGCMSQANVDYVCKHNPEVDPRKVEICPNAIEVQDLSVAPRDRLAIREKYGIPQDKKVFLYGGNLGKPQGIPFLMECLKSQADNPNAFFLIVGDGTEFGKLEKFFASEQLSNAKLLKKLPKEDYDRMVGACDVGLIFLDHRFTIPNFPSRLLAYLQAKVPVLACTDPNTDIGKVITGGGFGWWCESNSTQQFRQCVEQALESDLSQMGQTGYAYLQENYTSRQAAEKILSAISR